MKKTITLIVLSLFLSIQSVDAARKIFLDNVAVWETIAGITFQNSSFGRATGTYDEGTWKYEVLAEVFNFPTLPQAYIYQGWVVDPSSQDHVAAGEIIFNGSSSNSRINEKIDFSIQKDLRTYTNYSVTVERGAAATQPSDMIILSWRMDFRLLRSASRNNSLKSEKNLSTDEKLTKIKEKVNNTSDTTNIKAPVKKTSVATVASIIRPRIETIQQELLLKRLSNISQERLLRIKALLPEVLNKFRNEEASVRDRSAKIRLINDVETVINYITQ